MARIINNINAASEKKKRTPEGGRIKYGQPIGRHKHTVPKVAIRTIPTRVNKLIVKKEPGKISPEVYDHQRFPHIAETLCREYGMDKQQLADIFGVSYPCISKWCTMHKEFADAVKRGRDDFDGIKVENALLKRALGYSYKERTIRTVKVKAKNKYDDFEILIPAEEIVISEKEMAADVRAITFWLTNRQKERWQMITTVNANINAKTEHVKKTLNVTADLSKMDVGQLKALKEMVALQDDGKSIESDPEIDMIPFLETAATLIE